jgi:hypothetical protein
MNVLAYGARSKLAEHLASSFSEIRKLERRVERWRGRERPAGNLSVGQWQTVNLKSAYRGDRVI